MRTMRRTVLLVDDHAGFRRAARRLLESHDYHVVGEAADGLEGHALAARLRLDIVLVDVVLPALDGISVARRLSTPNGPTVVLISSRKAADFGARLDAGPAFIHKGDLSAESIAEALGAER